MTKCTLSIDIVIIAVDKTLSDRTEMGGIARHMNKNFASNG